MRYSGVIENDVANGEGFCVSFWVQGCPHHCEGCQNPQTWSFEDGFEDDIENIISKLKQSLCANGIVRNFSVLGGEPLCSENAKNVLKILSEIRLSYPQIVIYLWTGYLFEELISYGDATIQEILKIVDILIDGRFIESEKDLTLKLRGSRNQRIIDVKESLKEDKVVKLEP